MRILIADTFLVTHIERLRALGHDVVVDPTVDVDTLPAAISGHDVLVVRSTGVTAAALSAADRLALIVRAGTGVNTIDISSAADRGVVVSNTPGKNAIAVAELTMGLILAIDRNIPDNVAELRAGAWDKERWSQADGLAGKRLGIVGFGSIGIEVARRAKGFGMAIVIVDKQGRPADISTIVSELGVQLVPDIETLLRTSDIISFHVPATPDTFGMINRELLGNIRSGSVLINTSRGEIADEEALLAAIEEKGLRVGLDVYATEPTAGVMEFSSKLARHPLVYGTHHIGASTRQAQRAIADEVIEVIEAFGRGVLRNAVNLADEPATIKTRSGAISGSQGPLMESRSAIRPFAAYLPNPELASEIVAPPLSMITSERYEQLVASSPLSILHVLRAAIDSAEGGRGERLGEAGGREALEQLISNGKLENVGCDAFYIYRITTKRRAYLGVIAEVAVDGLAEGVILPHENTRTETEQLVLDHFRNVRAHTDPVMMTYRADPKLSNLLAHILDRLSATLDFEADDGSRQQLWVVCDPSDRDAIASRLALVSRLYIADGHHRTSAACRFADQEAFAKAKFTGLEAYNYLPAVLFADDQIGLESYHRVVADVGDLDPASLLVALEKELRVEEVFVPWDEEAQPQRPGTFGMFLDGRWYRVTFPPLPVEANQYDRLDTVRLQRTVLDPIFGITEPREDPRLQYVPGPAGLAELTRRANAVGFALYAPAPQAVMLVADEGYVMPPKSTWFEPKVRAGILVRVF